MGWGREAVTGQDSILRVSRPPAPVMDGNCLDVSLSFWAPRRLQPNYRERWPPGHQQRAAPGTTGPTLLPAHWLSW